MKKNIFHTILCALVLCACNTEAPYITKDTEITFEAINVMGTQMSVIATPKDDRAYYYFNIIEKSKFEQMNLTDEHFMTVTLDSLYRSYLDWRKDYLFRNEEYITSFRSHTFHYGTFESFYINLRPQTEYLVYGFVINPVNIQLPVGKLHKMYIKTTDIIHDVSPMVIDFKVNTDDHYAYYPNPMDPDNPMKFVDGIISIRPSVNGRPTKDPYVFSFISDKDLAEMYDNSIEAFVDTIVAYLATSPYAQSFIQRDIYMMDVVFDVDEGYWLVGAAYRTSYKQALFTRRFQSHTGLKLDYGHDEDFHLHH